MGYTTKFSGSVKLSRPLTLKEAKTILEWNDDPESLDFGDTPPIGSYMQWVPSETLDSIGWDGNEKFYNYVEWLQFVCDWLSRLGIAATGELTWSGESAEDTCVIRVVDNKVTSTENESIITDFIPITLSELADMALEQATKE
jgi:hypothetical protein